MTNWLVSLKVDAAPEIGFGASGPGNPLGSAWASLKPAANDNFGRRTSMTFGNGVSQAFTYDPVSRLASLTNNVSGTTNDLTIGSIAYSPASQIVSQARSNDAYAFTGLTAGSTPSIANGLNQLTSIGGSATAHDAKGNVTGAPVIGKTYGYSSENLLTSASGGVTLAYDPVMRLHQVSGAATTRFVHDGLAVIAEYNGFDMLQRRYVHGPGTDEPIVQYEGIGTTNRTFLHADERGSIIALSNTTGGVTQINKYDEYGTPAAVNEGRFQYTGQMWIEDVGAYHYKARFYSPHEGGRFLQTDPLGYEDSPNLYAYVLNDPVNLVDPLGLAVDCGGKQAEVCGRLWPVDPIGTTGAGGIGQAGSGLSGRQLGLELAGPPVDDDRPIIVRASKPKPISRAIGVPHKFVIGPLLSPCPVSSVFGYFKERGHSAPGAPAAKEGLTPRIVLYGNNPISQYVSSVTGTIVNTTLFGHIFHPGDVTIQVSPVSYRGVVSSQTSTITITGVGTGDFPEANEFFGEAWFGAQAAGALNACGR